MTIKTSKKDEMKKAIMNFLNTTVGSVARKDINETVKDLGSDRTVGRALAELKLDGKVLQTKDGKSYNWTSTEPKGEAPSDDTAKAITKSEKKNDAAEKAEKVATKADKKHDLDSFDKEWIAGLVDQELIHRKLKATKININMIHIEMETTTFFDKIKKDFPNVWENRNGIVEKKETKPAAKKTISKKELVNAGKVTRNSSDSGKEKAPKKAGKKGPGVIATIIKSISKKSRTKKQILKKLTKAFPERAPEKMMKTINVQVPSRLRKDKGLTIEKTDKGYLIVKK